MKHRSTNNTGIYLGTNVHNVKACNPFSS